MEMVYACAGLASLLARRSRSSSALRPNSATRRTTSERHAAISVYPSQARTQRIVNSPAVSPIACIDAMICHPLWLRQSH